MLGRFPALAGVDLDVESGEIVLLAGANGAGKTTLLRLCAGLLPLRSGSAEVLGVDLAVDRRAIRRSLALVGHETFCYDDLTVRENIRFATRATGRSVADADAALDRLGLQRSADVTHSRLSQGQRRRVALAIALARDPRLLLLDEPHAGLDEQSRNVLNEVVLAAPAEGRTVLLASHELEIARQLATREIRISAGQMHEGTAAAPVSPLAPADGPVQAQASVQARAHI
jgi:heme ABC exporter ATP-binding subunit CcmA